MLALALLAAGCPEPPADPSEDFRASVAARPVTRGRVERTLETTGTVRAREHAKILAEAGGRLEVMVNPATGRRFAIGDAVMQGQLLAIVAAEELRTSSRLDARRKALDVARAEYERNKRLRDEGLVSDTVIADFESKLSSARAEHENALLQQSKARIVAPLSGFVTSITTAADGEFVSERTVVAEIMRFDEVLVDLDLGAGDAPLLKPGLPVRVELPGASVPGAQPRTVDGIVERVAPAIDPVSRTFRVEVGVANPEHVLRPGMFVRASIVLDARDGVLVVPSEAVVDRGGKWTVFVVEAQRAASRTVEVGLASETSAEILSGVREGDLVITSGQETLEDGARVTVRQ